MNIKIFICTVLILVNYVSLHSQSKEAKKVLIVTTNYHFSEGRETNRSFSKTSDEIVLKWKDWDYEKAFRSSSYILDKERFLDSLDAYYSLKSEFCNRKKFNLHNNIDTANNERPFWIIISEVDLFTRQKFTIDNHFKVVLKVDTLSGKPAWGEFKMRFFVDSARTISPFDYQIPNQDSIFLKVINDRRKKRLTKRYSRVLDGLPFYPRKGREADTAERTIVINTDKELEKSKRFTKELRRLDIYCDDCISLPITGDSLMNLEFLQLGTYSLKYLPDSFKKLKSLKRLNVDIKFDLPQFICELDNIEVLRVNCSHMKSIPSCLNELESLRVLYFYGFRRAQADFVKGFEGVSTLWLVKSEIPELTVFQGLKYLIIDSPKGALNKVEIDRHNIETLELRDSDLFELPNWVFELYNLRELTLTNIELQKYEIADFRKLKSLRKLRIVGSCSINKLALQKEFRNAKLKIKVE